MRRRFWAAITLLALLGAAAYFFGVGRARFSPEAAEVAALRRQLEQLQQRFEELSAASLDQALVSAPSDGLVIGVPTEVARDVARQIVSGYLGNVRLTLRDKRVRKSGEVQGRVLLAQRTVGTFELEVQILKVTATLRPRELRTSFEGRRLGFSVPVAVADGHGRVRLKLVWNSKGLADLVCGDLEATRDLDGRLIPGVYPLAGFFDVVAEGGSLLLRPRVANGSIRVRVEATEQAWRAFDELMAGRSGLCQKALANADVKGQLAAILAKGWDVKLPLRLLRDIALPASVQESLKLNEGVFTLKFEPANVVMTPQWLWYGTSVTVERASS